MGAHFQTFFSTIFLFLTFLNSHIYFIILKTYDQQFTLTTKKSLHIIFKVSSYVSNLFYHHLSNKTSHSLHKQENKKIFRIHFL